MVKRRRVIGVDESGKGDFFGPLVIAAFLADDSDETLLRAAGVRDSKLISDKKILEIDSDLRQDFPHEVLVISPEDYNRRYKQIKNLNKLLADGHAETIDRILRNNEAESAVSDKFGKTELVQDALRDRNRSIDLKQIVRGESVVQVAAASIMARAGFILEMRRISESLGFELPRGASAIVDEAGRALVRQFGSSVLSRVAKLHFKNYQRVVNPGLFPK